MANYVSRTVGELPEYMFAGLNTTAAGLVPGNVVVAETLDTTISGNQVAYAPAQVTDANTQKVALVLNGQFETMSDGRRPDGNPDWTTYVYNQGDIAEAVRLMPNQRFEISVDACDATVQAAATAGTLVAGDNLIPKNGLMTLTFSASGIAITTPNYLTVEKLNYFRDGGLYGAKTITTMIVRVH